MEAYQQSIGGMIQLSEQEFQKISQLVYTRFGINLTEKKKALVRGRLNKLIRAAGLDTFQDYLEYVEKDTSGRALISLVDKISTNHSYLFRENEHFEFLRNRILPELTEELKSRRERDIRFWSAGCAAGEEPYTLAIVLREYFGSALSNWNIGILATDISITALQAAVKGEYNGERLRAVPEQLKKRYFTQTGPDKWKVREDIKDMILFKRLNFMAEGFPFKGKFHVIFCRNVMIYFDTQTKMDLVEKFHRYMHPGGYLFIGHSESLGRETQFYQYIQPAIYRKQ